MVIDSSALISILFGESEALIFSRAIADDARKLISALNALETGIVVEARKGEAGGREFDLLLHFARNAGRVFTRAQLLDAVWGYGHDGYEHTVNSHINRLRSKIEKNPGQPGYILTVWGVGYKFAELSKESGP